MIFGSVPLAKAKGGLLAHSITTADRVLRKGTTIDAVACSLLEAAGYNAVTIARLEAGDVPEGKAAARLGELLLGPGLRRSKDTHGRVNLFAQFRGLLRLNSIKVRQLNRIDEAVTLATLADRTAVGEGKRVATVKIIPFAVPAVTMYLAEALAEEGDPALAIIPFKKMKVGLILTKLPHLKNEVIVQTIQVTQKRILDRDGTMLLPKETQHETPPLVDAITALLASGADMILISGASAATDRLDVAPKAIIIAGGMISHFGMPVDPGNLICLGIIGATPVIVLPGCARSPARNGIDWVLDRLFAGEAVAPEEISEMSIGGLLR